MALTTILAAAALRGPSLRAVGVGAALLALGGAAASVVDQAGLVERVVGAAPHRTLRGKFLPARAMSRCETLKHSRYYGYADPLRHRWADVLDVDGVTPYVFAFNAYLPLWFRPEVVGVRPVPNEALMLTCEATELVDEATVARVFDALSWPDYAGVILYGEPEPLARALRGLPDRRVVQLGAGVVLLPHDPADRRSLGIDLGFPAAGTYRLRGGWGEFKETGGRRGRLARLPGAAIDFELDHGGPAVLRLRGRLEEGEGLALGVVINGTLVGSVELARAPGDYSFAIPAGHLRRGANRLEWSAPGQVISEAGWGVLWVDAVSLTPADDQLDRAP